VVSAEPIPAKSEAAEVRNSGAASRYDMLSTYPVSPIPQRRHTLSPFHPPRIRRFNQSFSARAYA
jgi:hypothetical protein